MSSKLNVFQSQTHMNKYTLIGFKKLIKDGIQDAKKSDLSSLNLSRKHRRLKLNSILESSLERYNSAY